MLLLITLLELKKGFCLKGFELRNKNELKHSWCNVFYLVLKNGHQTFHITDYSDEKLEGYKCKTIEDLIFIHNLTLTPSAIKQIGL